jgi:hypothetical protein
MRQAIPHATQCHICSRVAALKARAEPIGRLKAKPFHRSSEANPSPRQSAAAEWQDDADAFLRREMARHSRCAKCGILTGPGHIEAGDTALCGTCQGRNPGLPAPATKRHTIGRRGWHSDYSLDD